NCIIAPTWWQDNTHQICHPVRVGGEQQMRIKQNTHLAELMQQMLPVIPKAKRPEVVQSCINRSELWKCCKVFTLTRSMRVNEYFGNEEIDLRKQNFNRWVLAVGDGKLPAKKKEIEDEPTWIEIPKEFLIKSTDDADAINEFMFKKLGGVSMTYNSTDEICKASTDIEDQHHLYMVDFLNTLNFPGMPPHALCLKRELLVMLIQNMNPTLGLCNDTRLIITDLVQFVIQAKIFAGSHIGDSVLIHRIMLTST
ncbi:ATP-dependent DNA helicase PIF1-like protein, partial [Tanacetum coccineum]